jgi:hypothetical protein
MKNPRNLTEAEAEQVFADITGYPDATACFYETPCDEACKTATTISFGVIQRGAFWDTFCADDEGGLIYGKTFRDRGSAIDSVEDWAYETQEAGEEGLSELKDLEWIERTPPETDLVGPFTFEDNTDHEAGWDLETVEDVFAFFERKPDMFSPENWGNLYHCCLTDLYGRGCWVERSHRGEMRLVMAGV